jgi:hypothetical protein
MDSKNHNEYSIQSLFSCLCDNKYTYCRKCIFTPLRLWDGVNNSTDECCLDCPKLNDEIVWYPTPPLSPVHFGPEGRNEYKDVCTKTRTIFDFCVWCSLLDKTRCKESLCEFLKSYRDGTISPIMQKDVVYDLDDLGFFWQNFKLIVE